MSKARTRPRNCCKPRRNQRQPQQHRRRRKSQRRGSGHLVGPDCPGQPRPEPTHRGASFSAGRSGCLDGAAQLNRQVERRQRQAGESARTRCFSSRDEGRSSGQPSGRHDEGHQQFFANDRRHHLGDRRHRLPDQHICAECRGRNCACRRTGPRLRGGGFRNAQSARSFDRRGQADQGLDRRWGRACRAGHGSGQPSRCDDDSGRQLDQASCRHHGEISAASSEQRAGVGQAVRRSGGQAVRRSARWTRRRR